MMEFFSGVMVGLIIGVIIICILQVIPDEDDEFEIDVEEEKDTKE